MKIAIAADHGGFQLKKVLVRYVENLGHAVRDIGTNDENPVDYPDYARAIAHAILDGKADRGILICGSGVGAGVAVNKFAGIRAAVCHDSFSAHQGVEDDDMNVLCLGARVIGPELAKDIVRIYLAARFSGAERHVRRVGKIAEIEKECTALKSGPSRFRNRAFYYRLSDNTVTEGKDIVMKVGYIGLGKMGFNMVERLLEKKHQVAVYDKNEELVKAAAKLGAQPTGSLKDMVDGLPVPRLFWIMVPYQAVDAVLGAFALSCQRRPGNRRRQFPLQTLNSPGRGIGSSGHRFSGRGRQRRTARREDGRLHHGRGQERSVSERGKSFS